MFNAKTMQGLSGWMNSYHYSYQTKSQKQDKNEESTKPEKEDSKIFLPTSDKHTKKILKMNLLNRNLGPAGLL